jgi:hypothetical protein
VLGAAGGTPLICRRTLSPIPARATHPGSSPRRDRVSSWSSALVFGFCLRSPDKVEKLIKDDVETLALWREAVTPQHGGKHDSKSDNITLDDRGTSRSGMPPRPAMGLLDVTAALRPV